MIGKMEVPFLPLIHQISNTANYAIIMLCPIAMSMMNFLTNGFHPIDSYRRVPDEPTKFFLMDLRSDLCLLTNRFLLRSWNTKYYPC